MSCRTNISLTKSSSISYFYYFSNEFQIRNEYILIISVKLYFSLNIVKIQVLSVSTVPYIASEFGALTAFLVAVSRSSSLNAGLDFGDGWLQQLDINLTYQSTTKLLCDKFTNLLIDYHSNHCRCSQSMNLRNMRIF